MKRNGYIKNWIAIGFYSPYEDLRIFAEAIMLEKSLKWWEIYTPTFWKAGFV
jgi:hypothetical protein